jgi:5'-3' exonuclease
MKIKTLLVDGEWNLKRNFLKRQDLFSKGEHCGGSFGFLDSLRSITDKVMPDRVVVFWDGVMSGKFRKDIYPMYKGNRENKSWDEESYYFTAEELTEEEERKYSTIKQKIKVKNYLEELCIRQVEVEFVEADDLLALYVKNKNKDEQIVIYSSDKDFLQLIDEDVVLVRPSDGKTITTKNFKEVMGYTHENALFVKCLEGDVSDNITGVKGIGLTKLKTYIPRFFDEKYTLSMLIKEAEEKSKEKPLKFYDALINGRRTIELNRELMNLKSPMVNQKAIDEVEEILDCIIVMPDIDNDRSINNATKMMVKDGFIMHVFNRDLNLFFKPFYRIISREKEYSKMMLEKVKK